MGVDYYTCKNCGETYADCGHYGNCSHCENDYCGECYDEFVEKYGVIDKTHKRYDWFGESLIECDHCNGTIVDKGILLNYLLTKLSITEEEIKAEYLTQNKESNKDD